MGLSRTASDMDGYFRRKSKHFPTPCILRPRWRGNWISPHGVKKLEWWATGPRKKFDDIFSHVDTIHQRDRQTDRRTDGHRASAKTALTHIVAR